MSAPPSSPEAMAEALRVMEEARMREDPHNLRGLNTRSGVIFVVVSTIFLVIAFAAVIMRIWSKHLLQRKYQLHDWFMFLGFIFGLGYTIISLISVRPGGVGLHLEDVIRLYPDALVVTMKCFFASVFFWVLATTFVKLSILHMYVGIFRTKVFVWSAYAVAFISAAFCVGYVLTGFLVCRPFKYHWDKSIPNGTCGDSIAQEIAVAAINMILDFAIVCLPMPVLWGLQMPTKKKLMLMGVLSLGLCICAINITRIILIVQSDHADVTFSLVWAGLFSGLEITIGITTGCLPTFGPLIWKRNSQKSGMGDTGGYSGGSRSTPMKNQSSIRSRSLYLQTDFERLGEDDVPLRTVAQGGSSSNPSLVGKPEGITVRTDMQVYSAPAGNVGPVKVADDMV